MEAPKPDTELAKYLRLVNEVRRINGLQPLPNVMAPSDARSLNEHMLDEIASRTKKTVQEVSERLGL